MNIEFVEEITSTNTVLLERAKEQKNKEEQVLVAFCQTAGKGRKGRSFYSPSETGLYMSILLYPKYPVSEVLKLTPLMAVAAAKALEDFKGEPIDIKWVNDLYRNGRKISGILTECSPKIENGIPEYVVIGTGINLFTPEGGFPEDIRDRAGSLFDENDISVKKEDRNAIKRKLAIDIIGSFEKYYEGFPTVNYLEDYRKRLFIVGKEVLVSDGRKGTVLGVDDNFGLKIRFVDGGEDILNAGEVSLTL